MFKSPYKGKFRPKYPEKYVGDVKNITYRSLLERKAMIHIDRNRNVLKWASEEVIVPYRCTVDGKIHRYFPDFVVRVKKRDGTIETVMIEVKPYVQTIAPKKRRKTSKYQKEVLVYAKNISKWEYAKEYCKKRNWRFDFLTEKTILPYKRKS